MGEEGREGGREGGKENKKEELAFSSCFFSKVSEQCEEDIASDKEEGEEGEVYGITTVINLTRHSVSVFSVYMIACIQFYGRLPILLSMIPKFISHMYLAHHNLYPHAAEPRLCEASCGLSAVTVQHLLCLTAPSALAAAPGQWQARRTFGQ